MDNPKRTAPDKNPKLAEANAEFERRMLEMTKQTRPVTMALVPAVILSSALLGAAGIAGIRLEGLGLLKFAIVSNLIVDVAAAIFQFIAQQKATGIMKWYFGEIAAVSGAGDATPLLQMTMQFGLYSGMFFAIFWLALKVAYYVVSLVYFSKRPVADAYSGRPGMGVSS
jgi:hypothetical protein